MLLVEGRMIRRSASALMVVSLAAVGGCAGDGTSGHHAPPGDSPLALVVTDRPGQAFEGRGGVTIMPAAGAITSRVIHVQVATWRDDEQVVVAGFLSDAEVTALAGQQPIVTPAALSVSYQLGEDTAATDRRVVSMSLELHEGSLDLTLQLAELVHAGSPVPGPTSAEATITGVLPLSCADRDGTGSHVPDPRWESDFCSTTRVELGLDGWIDAF
jgi:hypothetical protein